MSMNSGMCVRNRPFRDDRVPSGFIILTPIAFKQTDRHCIIIINAQFETIVVSFQTETVSIILVQK